MTQMTPDPITGEYGPDPMLRGMTGEDLFNRRMGITSLFGQGGQNPYEWARGQKPPQDGQIRQPPPQGGWNIQDILGGPRGQLPPKWQQPQGDPYGYQGFGEQIGGFGETLGGYGEQLGGLGEQIGGYKEQMGGFGEQLGGFGEQLGGFKDEFSNINNRLQSMEQGITSLTDKFGVQQQQPQNPFQGLSSMFFGGGGYGNPYSGYSYF